MHRGCNRIIARPACSGCAGPWIPTPGCVHIRVGVDVIEPPMMCELQKAGIDVRDGQQVMLEARQIKSGDEITLLNIAASMVDGVYQDIYEALKPGIRETA